MDFTARPIALIAMIAAVLLPGNTHESPALPSVPFDQPGDYEFHFRQAHGREMTLLLEVEPQRQSDRQALTHLETIIEAQLLNHAGRTVCQAAGSPGEGIGDDHWVLRLAKDEAAFWHRGCAEIKLKRSESYTLKLRIGDVDSRTPKVRLTPILERSDDFGP